METIVWEQNVVSTIPNLPRQLQAHLDDDSKDSNAGNNNGGDNSNNNNGDGNGELKIPSGRYQWQKCPDVGMSAYILCTDQEGSKDL